MEPCDYNTLLSILSCKTVRRKKSLEFLLYIKIGCGLTTIQLQKERLSKGLMLLHNFLVWRPRASAACFK